MASSSNPIPATTSSSYYDVFLNHRGIDVKETLATHLYKRLIVRGVRVFLDKEELQEGDHIPSHLEGSIRSASVHIAIFSTNYALSNWCLNELLLMLDSGKTIIPIFYCVKPSELRWTLGENGVYARSLRILEEQKTVDPQTRLEIPRYDADTIGKWRRALYQVADIKGFEMVACNSDDSQLVDNVVERVLKKLPKTPLNVSKYPTGLDDKVKDLERTVFSSEQNGEKCRVVGIVGLGGVGKTTLAKEIFNRERSKYHLSCFVPDVREPAPNSPLNSLEKMQSFLLEALTESKVQIKSTDEGIGELERRVSSCHAHAFIILDDVDHGKQIDALLLPVKNALSSGSLILVTSRNKDVLTSSGIAGSSIYKLEGLNPQHSHELFCLHAFGQPYPVVGFEQVVQEFLNSCKGLPLSLKVIGASLCGKDDLEYWQEQLHKISKILPQDIQSILKISYDGLDEEEKQIFLDIACFFIGGERDRAIIFWNGSGWAGWMGLRNLENRCLVDVEENKYGKYLRMHDHLRDLGRDLAEKEPVRGHRLWRPTENLLQNLSDKSPVRGIWGLERRHLVDFRRNNRQRRRSLDQTPVELGSRSISMSSLELLRTDGDCLKDILNMVQSPQYLIWLHCYSFPYASLPRWIPMERLRILYVAGSKLRRLWGERIFEAPLQLRQLEIEAPLLKFPKFIGQLKYLEKIVLNPPFKFAGEACKIRLKTLPDEFCDLQCLKHLELNHCSEMESLPESLGSLKNLQCIRIVGCLKLRALPKSFGNLKLKVLQLWGFESLTIQSGCVENNITIANTFGCVENIITIPNTFRNLSELNALELWGCDSYGSLIISNLTPGNISTFRFIDMSSCKEIDVLPPQVADRRSLAELHLGFTNSREWPSASRNIRDLEVLDFGSPSLKALPPWLGCLCGLKKLRICFSKQLKCLPDSIRELTKLKELSIEFTGIKYLPPCIMKLNNLEHLYVLKSPLRKLPFKRVVGFREAADASKCMLDLKVLILISTRISEVAFDRGVCPNLQHLYIRDCAPLVKFGTLPNTLIKLELKNCPFLKKIEGLCGLPKLQTLNIRNCPILGELSGLTTLKSLETLKVSGSGITSIQGLRQLTKLRELKVSNCQWLEEIAGIEHLMWLGMLIVYNCPRLQYGEEVAERLRQRAEKDLSALTDDDDDPSDEYNI